MTRFAILLLLSVTTVQAKWQNWCPVPAHVICAKHHCYCASIGEINDDDMMVLVPVPRIRPIHKQE